MSTGSLRVESCPVRPVEQALQASTRKRVPTSLGLGRTHQQATVSTMRVGFIGLGPIAQAMAFRLLKAGHQLTLFDPARKIPDDLISAGVSVAISIESACRWVDAVFTMLPNDEAAEAVILGPGGVVESLPGDAIHIGSSTISVECSDRIVEAHWDAGKRFVSAPVLVRSGSAAQMELSVIAGGREATIIAIEPLLNLIGQLTQISGWPSDANLVQQGVNRSGGNLLQFLARHLERRALQDRLQPGSLAFPGYENGLDTKIKGVAQ